MFRTTFLVVVVSDCVAWELDTACQFSVGAAQFSLSREFPVVPVSVEKVALHSRNSWQHWHLEFGS